MQLLVKERNKVALSLSSDVERSRTGTYHITVAQMSEVNTNNFERTAVQLWLSALVRVEQRIDDCAPVVFQREKKSGS